MRITIVTPAKRGARSGNRVTAERWARLLRELGHVVRVQTAYDAAPSDVLIALHARKSQPSVTRFHSLDPARPIIVGLAGTDLYGDLDSDSAAQRSLALAARLIVLQDRGVRMLNDSYRSKTRVIFQSATRVPGTPRHRPSVFDVCVLGHLRPVKDPFRAAYAARKLPSSSNIRIVHIGAALESEMAREAAAEQERNERYRWLGEAARANGLRVLARSKLLVVSSRSEGGANVVSEAIVNSVPVVSSAIDGSIGVLGEDYPGYFPVGDTKALATLLSRCERDAGFYQELKQRCAEIAPKLTPERERESWREVLEELGVRS